MLWEFLPVEKGADGETPFHDTGKYIMFYTFISNNHRAYSASNYVIILIAVGEL